jgi:hypothetical protein
LQPARICLATATEIAHEEMITMITDYRNQTSTCYSVSQISITNARASTPLSAKIRVENLHYDITEDELHVSFVQRQAVTLAYHSSRICSNASHLSNPSGLCMTVPVGPTGQLSSSTLTSQMPEVQSVSSTVQTPRANQSAWSFYLLPLQLLAEVRRGRAETIRSIESRIRKVYLKGSKRRRVGREEQEVRVPA